MGPGSEGGRVEEPIRGGERQDRNADGDPGGDEPEEDRIQEEEGQGGEDHGGEGGPSLEKRIEGVGMALSRQGVRQPSGGRTGEHEHARSGIEEAERPARRLVEGIEFPRHRQPGRGGIRPVELVLEIQVAVPEQRDGVGVIEHPVPLDPLEGLGEAQADQGDAQDEAGGQHGGGGSGGPFGFPGPLMARALRGGIHGRLRPGRKRRAWAGGAGGHGGGRHRRIPRSSGRARGSRNRSCGKGRRSLPGIRSARGGRRAGSAPKKTETASAARAIFFPERARRIRPRRTSAAASAR